MAGLSERRPLAPAMINLVEASGLHFMDRDGEKYGVQLINPSVYASPPMVDLAGREIIVHGIENKVLWHLRLEAFFKQTEGGLLYYYVPIPKELEIPKEW